LDEVIELPLQTASATRFPLVVPVTATVGEPLPPKAVTAVPKLPAPVNETEPAAIDAVVVVMATVFVPEFGLINPNSWTYPAGTWLSDCTFPSEVIDTPLYVQVVVPVTPRPIAAETTKARLDPVQVCDHVADVAPALAVVPAPPDPGPTASNATAIGHPPLSKRRPKRQSLHRQNIPGRPP
jgi:hypothetical protein